MYLCMYVCMYIHVTCKKYVVMYVRMHYGPWIFRNALWSVVYACMKCTCVCMYMYMYMYMYVYEMHMCVCMCICICMKMHMCVYVLDNQPHLPYCFVCSFCSLACPPPLPSCSSSCCFDRVLALALMSLLISFSHFPWTPLACISISHNP